MAKENHVDKVYIMQTLFAFIFSIAIIVVSLVLRLDTLKLWVPSLLIGYSLPIFFKAETVRGRSIYRSTWRVVRGRTAYIIGSFYFVVGIIVYFLAS